MGFGSRSNVVGKVELTGNLHGWPATETFTTEPASFGLFLPCSRKRGQQLLLLEAQSSCYFSTTLCTVIWSLPSHAFWESWLFCLLNTIWASRSQTCCLQFWVGIIRKDHREHCLRVPDKKPRGQPTRRNCRNSDVLRLGYWATLLPVKYIWNLNPFGVPTKLSLDHFIACYLPNQKTIEMYRNGSTARCPVPHPRHPPRLTSSDPRGRWHASCVNRSIQPISIPIVPGKPNRNPFFGDFVGDFARLEIEDLLEMGVEKKMDFVGKFAKSFFFLVVPVWRKCPTDLSDLTLILSGW